MINFIVYFLMWMTCTSCSFIEDDDDRDKEIKDLAEMVDNDVNRESINYNDKVTKR